MIDTVYNCSVSTTGSALERRDPLRLVAGSLEVDEMLLRPWLAASRTLWTIAPANSRRCVGFGDSTMQRSIHLDAKRAADNAVPAVLSSDEPVDMGNFVEILDHSPEAVDLSRSPLPLIESHDVSRTPVGVIENLRLAGGKLRGLVRFGASTRARELLQDVLDGVVRSLSVGYQVLKHERQPDGTLRATRWMPFETSIVAVPADTAAGFYRSKPTMENSTITLSGAAADAARAERDRISAIYDLGTRHNLRDLADRAVHAGTSLPEFRGAVFERVGTKPLSLEQETGMTSKEAQRYSICRAILSQLSPDKYDGGLEREVSRAMAREAGRDPRGLWVPMSIARRDLTTGVGTGTAKAGNLVQTDVLGDQLIDVLRNKMVLNELGATFLTGLRGNVAIPRKTTASSVYWVAENTAPTESTNAPAFDQVTMTPKTLGGYVDLSRRLLLQSSVDVEALVRNDLATTIASAMDSAAIAGSGTNRPTGVLNTSGIGSVTLGTNGGAPTWSMVTNLIREVAIDNALNGPAAFLTNAQTVAKLMTTPRQSTGVEGNFILGADASLLGYRVIASQAVPSNLTKGSGSNLSAMMFGVWSDLIVGQWSGIDLLVDPYTGSNAGTVRIVAFHDCDFALRHPESVAECNEIVTT